MKKDVIAVDLDGTLAHWDPHETYDASKIGKPIMPMLERVKRWVKEGKEVVIHTARVGDEGAFPHIHAWLREHGLPELRITNKKLKEAGEFWDDRAVAVERNTGRILGGHTKHEQDWESLAREALK